jgi:hypothetical protein
MSSDGLIVGADLRGGGHNPHEALRGWLAEASLVDVIDILVSATQHL